MYSVESIIFILLLGELLIILLFILFYLTLQFYTVPKLINIKQYLYILVTLVILIIFNWSNCALLNITPINYYFTSFKIISDDFFLFFLFLFVDFPLTVYLLALILTFCSIFFIFFYLSCKFFSNLKLVQKKKIYLLRKQNLFHQGKAKTTYTTFQI